MHIQRTLKHLERAQVDYDLYLTDPCAGTPPRHRRFFGRLSKACSLVRLAGEGYDIIHHHSPDLCARAALALLSSHRRNVYLHVHGESLHDSLVAGGAAMRLLKACMKYVVVLSDNEKIAALARELGARDVIVMDAFIPPVYEKREEKVFLDRLARKGFELEGRDFVIGMVGWFRRYNGEDLYGFNILAEAVARLVRRYDVVVLVSVNGTSDPELREKFEGGLMASGLRRRFFLIEEDLPEIWPLYLYVDVFVRPTITDGNALSVKEAMWFGTHTIASDCVPRPDGVELFPSRDPGALALKLERAIATQLRMTPSEKAEIARRKTFRNRLLEEIYGVRD